MEEQLPTHCKTCGKRLDAVEILFNKGYCAIHEGASSKKRAYCEICATPLRGREAHYIDGLYYCSNHVPLIK